MTGKRGRVGTQERRDEVRVQARVVDLDDLRDARVVVGCAGGDDRSSTKRTKDDITAQWRGVAGADGQGAGAFKFAESDIGLVRRCCRWLRRSAGLGRRARRRFAADRLPGPDPSAVAWTLAATWRDGSRLTSPSSNSRRGTERTMVGSASRNSRCQAANSCGTSAVSPSPDRSIIRTGA